MGINILISKGERPLDRDRSTTICNNCDTPVMPMIRKGSSVCPLCEASVKVKGKTKKGKGR
ncbi:hypothetical protein KKD37_01100 [Patescibacteria group bacterium]|nr:hypothetical protein [Patescibacteria group bacterium]